MQDRFHQVIHEGVYSSLNFLTNPNEETAGLKGKGNCDVLPHFPPLCALINEEFFAPVGHGCIILAGGVILIFWLENKLVYT